MAQGLGWRTLAFYDPCHQEEKPEDANEYWNLLEASKCLLGSKLGFFSDVYIYRDPTTLPVP